MSKLLKVLMSRVVMVAVLIVLQAILLTVLVWKLSANFTYVYAFFTLLSSFMVIWVVNKKDNPSFKLPWIIIIMLLPVFGGVFYILFSHTVVSKATKDKIDTIIKKSQGYYPDDLEVYSELEKENKSIATQSKYIKNKGLVPVYKNTTVEYFPIGEEMFESMKSELEKAKHFIFMEYFIISEGYMWDSLLDILKRKAAEGLDVRVMYDDCGSLLTIPHNYSKTLESFGIKSVVFNPYRPVLSTSLHNRDHRKITVIDGYVGFNGGINLSDEYINRVQKHGHWKDCGIILKGEAVQNLTIMFLEMWNLYKPTDSSYEKFLPHTYHEGEFESEGFVQPYGDSPLDDEYLGETVYMNILNQATDYVYMNTPYFIVDNELLTALTNAAKRGVDVRLVTPQNADTWYVHIITQSYYKDLIDAGVKVYEYTPGFVHSKTFVADDNIAVVGTINLDYRSLYHNFECATWMYKTKAVMQLKKDFVEMLNVCELIEEDFFKKTPYFKILLRGLIKLCAPLM